MSLMTLIKEKQIEARKSKVVVAAGLLTTLMGEAAMVGKNAGRETTDAEVVAVVKKFIKNIDETLTAVGAAAASAATLAASATLLTERAILEQFLPLQLTELELQNLAEKHTAMPEFMKFLKENHAGQYDGKMASAVAKKVFN